MTKTSYGYVHDLEDDELIEEMERRGYSVFYRKTTLDEAAWHLQNDNLLESLIQIEREFPQMKGLAEALDRHIKK